MWSAVSTGLLANAYNVMSADWSVTRKVTEHTGGNVIPTTSPGSQMFWLPNVDIVFQKCTSDPSDPNQALKHQIKSVMTKYSNTTYSNQNLSKQNLTSNFFVKPPDPPSTQSPL